MMKEATCPEIQGEGTLHGTYLVLFVACVDNISSRVS